ncbi:uncharacterized protein [Aegilops tauschii subsp. strangulata]|nr:uncharacterized protein LOC123495168 [Aegilops tauschii subsp. strangulata]
MRRHSVSSILNSLIWLAYLSADVVAIFVLGHLAVHASGSHHLLIFWAPFLLLHLGGQDTITAFSMQDNELWQRHLLGLVTQVSVAIYVISISSWQGSRLLAATVLMFLSGFFKYIGRTFCLYTSRPQFLRDTTVLSLDRYVHGVYQEVPLEDILRQRVQDMVAYADDGKLPSNVSFSHILLDIPLNDRATIEGATIIPYFLNVQNHLAYRNGAYIYVSALLVRCYERIYTKAMLHFAWLYNFKAIMSEDSEDKTIRIVFLHILSFLLLFPLISALITLELFLVAEKDQLYNRTDITISYILLIGAIILEVASLFMAILSYFASSKAPPSCPLAPVALHVANYIHPAGRHRKHWSKMLAQYNIFECNTREDSTVSMAVAQWIGRTFSRIAISPDVEEFVLDKILDMGTWELDSFRGQQALERWTVMRTIIDSVDLPTSVLIWHIATEICDLGEESNTNSYQTKMIRVSRELSNYNMYLVFRCGVMLTCSSKLVHINTHREIKKSLGGNVNLARREAIRMVLQANREGQQPYDTDNIGGGNRSKPITPVQLLKNNIDALDYSPVLPRARTVADELNAMPGDDRWDLIAEVWLEMLFYIAPRCGSAFHAEHLSTGGEFVSHVLMIMRSLGPFLPPPDY